MAVPAVKVYELWFEVTLAPLAVKLNAGTIDVPIKVRVRLEAVSETVAVKIDSPTRIRARVEKVPERLAVKVEAPTKIRARIERVEA